MQEYADPVIDWLDAGRGILEHRFFRDVSIEFCESSLCILRTGAISHVHNFQTDHTRKTCP
jgi:hypothetical protein